MRPLVVSRHAVAGLTAALLCLCCARGAPPPAALDAAAGETCRWCRMAIVEPRTAAQIAAPLDEPIFFDDIGCLRDFLKAPEAAPAGAIAYVADHRTGDWVRASSAVYTQAAGLETPMGSGLIAHTAEASRDADPAASGGTRRTASDLFGPAGAPDGAER